MTSRERFDAAYATFVPAPDDSDCAIPFYRAYAGLRAAWGPALTDPVGLGSHVVHQAACYSGDAPGDRYDVACQTARRIVETTKLPPKPTPRYSYAAEPSKPTEQDAYEEFKAQYKRAFPGKRINSIHAKQQWAKVEMFAMQFVMNRYQQALAAHQQEEAQRQQQNHARRQEWIDKIHSIALLENMVRDAIR